MDEKEAILLWLDTLIEWTDQLTESHKSKGKKEWAKISEIKGDSLKQIADGIRKGLHHER